MKPGPGSPSPGTAGGSTSLYAWGTDRSRLTRAVRAVAARIDPHFEWVEALGSPDVVSRPRSVSLDDRPRPTSRDLGRCTTMAEPALLPAPIARLLGRPAPRVLVVANVDRLETAESAGPTGVGSLVEPLNWLGITRLATHHGRPAADRIDFAYSLAETSTLPRLASKGSALVCQWGSCDRCVVRERLGHGLVGCVGSILAAMRRGRSNASVPLPPGAVCAAPTEGSPAPRSA